MIKHEPMDKAVRDSWADIVEDDFYPLGKGFLSARIDGVFRYCPLGLLCELGVSEGVIPDPNIRSAGLLWTPGGPDEDTAGDLLFKEYDGETGILPRRIMNWGKLNQRTPTVNPSARQRRNWLLPPRYRHHGGVNPPWVPLHYISDRLIIDRRELGDLIRALPAR